MIVSINEAKSEVATPHDVHKILKSVLASESNVDRDKEHFWVFMLDTRNHIKTLDLISLGIINKALIHPREVFRRAIIEGCSSIILAHNHPSNQITPSHQDVQVTEQLCEAGKFLG